MWQVDKDVLAADNAGRDWKTIRGVRSRRRFLAVLRRAKERERIVKVVSGS